MAVASDECGCGSNADAPSGAARGLREQSGQARGGGSAGASESASGALGVIDATSVCVATLTNTRWGGVTASDTQPLPTPQQSAGD